MRRALVVNGPAAQPHRSPERTRLLAGDFILDIVRTVSDRAFAYAVHRRSSGEILTLGDADTQEQAERIAVWTVRQITGNDPGFNFDSDPPCVA
jgi:hypothetical protein